MFPNHVAKINPHHGLNVFGLGRGYELIADCNKSDSYDKKYASCCWLNLCPSGTCGMSDSLFGNTDPLVQG